MMGFQNFANRSSLVLTLAALYCTMCIRSLAADPKPLTKDEQVQIDQVVDRAVVFLNRTQTRQGDWPRFWPKQHVIGQCALPAYAFLEAGVPPEDPVIQKAAEFLRALVLLNDRTYELSLALLFFDRLGDPKDKGLIRTLALRLIAGQHVTGGWNYGCIRVAKEDLLVKALTELNKWQESGGQSRLKLLKGLHLPSSILTLAVFRDPRELPWQDPPESEATERILPIVVTCPHFMVQAL